MCFAFKKDRTFQNGAGAEFYGLNDSPKLMLKFNFHCDGAGN